MQDTIFSTPVRFEPGRWFETLRAMPAFERNNLIWLYVCGMAAAAGSAVSVVIWCSFIWAMWSVAARRFPLDMFAPMKLFAWACAFYATVKILFAVWHSELDGLGAAIGAFVFYAPLFIQYRLRLTSSRQIVDAFVIAAACGTVIAAFIAAYQTLWLNVRAEAFCGNPSVFAVMATLFGGIGGLNLHSPERKRRWLGIASLLAGLLCVIAAGTRSIWLVVPFYALFLALPASAGVRSLLVPRTMLTGLAAVLAIVFIAWKPVEQRVAALARDVAVVETRAGDTTSLGQRLALWDAAWDAILEAPLAGYGLADRMEAVRAKLAERGKPQYHFTHPHNGLMAAMLDAGVLGLLAVLAMLAAPIAAARRGEQAGLQPVLMAIALMLVTVYVASGMFGILFEHDLMDSVFVLVGMIVATAASEDSPVRGTAR